MKIIELEGHPVAVDNLSKDSIVFDCGACIGEFALKLYNMYKCKFYLYEPDPRNFRRLERRFGINENIHISDNGIDKTIGIKEFHLGNFITASSFFESHRGLGNLWKNVQTTTLDKEMDTLAKIDLLKLDLEGSELDVIPNISKYTLHKINQITVEFHPQSKIDEYTQERIDICRNYLKELFDEIIYVDKGNDGHHGLYLNKNGTKP